MRAVRFQKHAHYNVHELWVLRSGPAVITVRSVVAVWTVTALQFRNARLPRSNAVRTPRLRGPIPPREARGNLHLVTRVATYLRVNWSMPKGLLLLHDDAFNELPNPERLMLIMASLVSRATMGLIPADYRTFMSRTRLRHDSAMPKHFKSLQDKGLFSPSSMKLKLSIEDEVEDEMKDQKQLPSLASLASLATESENGGDDRKAETNRRGDGEKPSAYAPALEGSGGDVINNPHPRQVDIIPTPKSLNVNNLGDSHDPTVSAVGACGEGEEGGAENSEEPPSSQASRNATGVVHNGTGRHSIQAGVANPVAGNGCNGDLGRPRGDGANSLPSVAGSQSGDAKGRPGDLARTAEGGPVVPGSKRAQRKPRDPLAADECWKWLLPYRAVWEAHFGAGSFAHRVAAPYLGPLHRAQGVEAVCANLERYLQRPDINAPNWSHFTQHFAKYGATPVTPLAAAAKPTRVCVQCHEPMGPDRGEYDRKPMHAHCINAWQMAGAIAS